MRLDELYKDDDHEQRFEEDCAYYLHLMGDNTGTGNRLWRGTTSPRAKVGEKNPWRPRDNPVDTPGEIHTAMNEYFDTHFGHPWRNGLFTSSLRRTAVGYGDPYVVVPVGHFEWLCNKDFPDMYKHLASALHNSAGYKTNADGEEMGEIIAKLVFDLDESENWKHNEDLPGCVNSNAEIILWCPNGYYLFDPEDLPRAIS